MLFKKLVVILDLCVNIGLEVAPGVVSFNEMFFSFSCWKSGIFLVEKILHMIGSPSTRWLGARLSDRYRNRWYILRLPAKGRVFRYGRCILGRRWRCWARCWILRCSLWQFVNVVGGIWKRLVLSGEMKMFLVIRSRYLGVDMSDFRKFSECLKALYS